MKTLPEDTTMLLGLINMKLRDFYTSLDELCEDMEIDRADLEERLQKAGYEYSEENRRFW